MIEFSKQMIGLLAAVMVMGASGQQKFSGEVTRVSPDSIEVSDGKIVKKFGRADDAVSVIRVGDRVTINYTLEANTIRLEKQKAGRAAPGKTAPNNLDKVPGHVPGKIDDRAFYES